MKLNFKLNNSKTLRKQVVIDRTSEFGCPECEKYRISCLRKSKDKTAIANGFKLKHWQVCREHEKCIRSQHLAHQEKFHIECPRYRDQQVLDDNFIDTRPRHIEPYRIKYKKRKVYSQLTPTRIVKERTPSNEIQDLTIPTPQQNKLILELLGKS